MEIEKINLNVPYEKAGLSGEGCSAVLSSVTLPVYPEIGRHKKTAMIICPGGGYEFCSDREAEPVAVRFLSVGIQCFVLRYSVVKKQFPTALLELASAVAYVRENAEKYDIDPDKIGICGFSAGGHLACSLGVHWNKDFVKNPLGFYNEEHKPNFMVLGYPVITSKDFTHQGSIFNITQSDGSQEMLYTVSLEEHVSKDTPKTFIWHCADDTCVPVENSLCLMSALSREKIPFECHIYPYGNHGLALADKTTAMGDWHIKDECANWTNLASDWILR